MKETIQRVGDSLVSLFGPKLLDQMLGHSWDRGFTQFALLRMVKALEEAGLDDTEVRGWFLEPHRALGGESPAMVINRDHVAVWHVIPPPLKRRKL